MARAEVEAILKKLSINDGGVLCYEEKQFLTENKVPAFQNLEFKKILSNGANGITFILLLKIKLKSKQLRKQKKIVV